MKKLLLILFCLPMIGFGQGWETTFGGIYFDNVYSVQQTTDGGYILAGNTGLYPNTGTFTDEADILLLKLYSNGGVQWSQTFNGTIISSVSNTNLNDYGRSVQQTSDGGYIITGYENYHYMGRPNIFLLKTDPNGIEQWKQYFGDSIYPPVTGDHYAYSVQQTTDGGFIIVGKNENNNTDVYLIKTDSNGIEQWNQSFGGAGADAGYSVQQTTDGGYIIGGSTEIVSSSNSNIYLIKTDGNGAEQWNQSFGGAVPSWGRSVQQTSDGGYIIVGGGWESLSNVHWVMKVIKTDGNGIQQWYKSFGGAGSEQANSVQQTIDGGYIVAGHRNGDAYLIKLDLNGDSLWARTFGEDYYDNANSVQQTSDGGYILAGSFYFNPSSGTQHADAYIIKTDSNGYISPTSDTTISLNGCDSVQGANGNYYYQSGVYVDTLVNIIGYDSIVTSYVTISYTTSSFSNIACDSYTWNDSTYTTSGSYSYTTSNLFGCDSTATLNLTINSSTISASTATACDTYTWLVNGNTYTTSGTYTNISTNNAGCDHTEILYLTINYSTSFSTYVTACDTYTWLVNGNTYTTSGTYTNISTNNAGCVLIETLFLTINYSSNGSSSDTICDSYDWGGVTYTTSGVYDNLFLNSEGCDSIHTLNLTINYSNNGSSSDTKCDSYDWGGVTYTTSGVYDNLFLNSEGCDSIHTLNLTINNAESSSIWQTGNELYAITFNNNSIEADWYNIQTQNEVTRIWLMEEQSSSFMPTFDCSYFLIYEDDFGCIDTSSVYYYSENAKRIGTITTSPNPTSNIVKAQFDNPKNQNVKLELINSSGIKLAEFFTIQNNLDIDLSKYPSGTYYLYFNSEDAIQGCRLEELQKISSKIILNK